jgi:hypothetical protein
MHSKLEIEFEDSMALSMRSVDEKEQLNELTCIVFDIVHKIKEMTRGVGETKDGKKYTWRVWLSR